MNVAEFVRNALVALCAFSAITGVIVIIATVKNNKEWLAKAEGDRALARKLKKNYWEENHEA